jgi:hypothetical protein
MLCGVVEAGVAGSSCRHVPVLSAVACMALAPPSIVIVTVVPAAANLQGCMITHG